MSSICNKWEMETAMSEIKQALKDRELIDPEVTLTISTKDWNLVHLDIQYRVRDDGSTTYKTFNGDGLSTMDSVFLEARHHIRILKSRTELDHDEFMLMLGRVMDRAKDLGMDEDFVNPLTAMMKKLASNALTS